MKPTRSFTSRSVGVSPDQRDLAVRPHRDAVARDHLAIVGDEIDDGAACCGRATAAASISRSWI